MAWSVSVNVIIESARHFQVIAFGFVSHTTIFEGNMAAEGQTRDVVKAHENNTQPAQGESSLEADRQDAIQQLRAHISVASGR